MAIEKVWIEEGCISCRLCEDTCPDVFVINDDLAAVKPDANLAANEESIKEAATNCPVEVIKYEE